MATALIQFQPMSPPIELMRALSEGGGVLWPVLGTLAWVVFFLQLCSSR